MEGMAPDAICDDSIVTMLELNVRQHANHKTRELAGAPAFDIRRDSFSVCGPVKLVLRHVQPNVNTDVRRYSQLQSVMGAPVVLSTTRCERRVGHLSSRVFRRHWVAGQHRPHGRAGRPRPWRRRAGVVSNRPSHIVGKKTIYNGASAGLIPNPLSSDMERGGVGGNCFPPAGWQFRQPVCELDGAFPFNTSLYIEHEGVYWCRARQFSFLKRVWQLFAKQIDKN